MKNKTKKTLINILEALAFITFILLLGGGLEGLILKFIFGL